MDDDDKEAGILDARDLACPWPVLKARKRLLGMGPGEILCLEATDPMSSVDIPHFCAEQGHELLGQQVEDGVYRFTFRRGPLGNQNSGGNSAILNGPK